MIPPIKGIKGPLFIRAPDLPEGDSQMTYRRQRGWLKKEKRSQGETWVLFFRTVRKSDGKRVENKIPIGLLKDFSSKSCAWEEVERQHLACNSPCARAVLFRSFAPRSRALGDRFAVPKPTLFVLTGIFVRV
jgi:hypothetical protein